MSNESNFDPPREAEQPRSGEHANAGAAHAPLILGLDTATGARSVGVFRGAEQLVLQICGQQAGSSSTVLGDIDRVLRGAAVEVREVELFALAIGPGSFTGLRAGLATVKALATTLRKKAVGVPTLHAVAHAAGETEGRVVALIPAGRGEVFAQQLSSREDGTVFEHGPPTHVAPGELVESVRSLGGRVVWAGEGAQKYRGLIEEAARAEGVKLFEGGEVVAAGRGAADDEGVRVWTLAASAGALAKDVAALAWAQLGASEAFEGANLRALYVRPADAKIGGA